MNDSNSPLPALETLVRVPRPCRARRRLLGAACGVWIAAAAPAAAHAAERIFAAGTDAETDVGGNGIGQGARWIAPADPDEWDLTRIAATGGGAGTAMQDMADDALLQEPESPEQAGPQQQADPPASDAPVTYAAGEIPPDWADHVPREHATHTSFGAQVGAIRTEALAMFGYFTIRAGSKLFGETEAFHFKDEGWFGKDTEYVGVDKLAHAWNSYLAAEILHNRLHRKTNASQGDALTAGALAFGFVAYNEISDAIEPDSGWSWNDVVMNGLGAGFSVLRNTVPGLKEKVAFKIEIVPNEDFWTYSGPRRFEQQRFMFSLKGAGFRQLEETPLRFLDLQLGYGAEDFEPEERAAGIEPRRHVFVGVGLNVGELLFGGSRSGFARAGWSALDYFQVPYTSVRVDQGGDLYF